MSQTHVSPGEALPRFRLLVSGFRANTPSGWAWWYQVHDMAVPEGRRIRISGARYTWCEALTDGLIERRRVEARADARL